MAEFKKLSEVEQIETASDNATVLIEEGGDIKRVPKSAVGGAGVGGYIVTITEDNIIDVNLSDPPLVWCSVNYDELYDILMAGGSAWLDISLLTTNQNAAPSAAVTDSMPTPTNFAGHKVTIQEWLITDVGLMVFVHTNLMGSAINVFFPNGSHNLEPNNNNPV